MNGAEEGGEAPCFAHLAPGFVHPVVDDAVLGRLVRNLADSVVIADAQGTIVFWNEASQRLFGWSALEAVGHSLDLIIPERLRDRHWNAYRRVMKTGHTD